MFRHLLRLPKRIVCTTARIVLFPVAFLCRRRTAAQPTSVPEFSPVLQSATTITETAATDVQTDQTQCDAVIPCVVSGPQNSESTHSSTTAPEPIPEPKLSPLPSPPQPSSPTHTPTPSLPSTTPAPPILPSPPTPPPPPTPSPPLSPAPVLRSGTSRSDSKKLAAAVTPCKSDGTEETDGQHKGNEKMRTDGNCSKPQENSSAWGLLFGEAPRQKCTSPPEQVSTPRVVKAPRNVRRRRTIFDSYWAVFSMGTFKGVPVRKYNNKRKVSIVVHIVQHAKLQRMN